MTTEPKKYELVAEDTIVVFGVKLLHRRAVEAPGGRAGRTGVQP
jgi:hypothetical protein